MTMTAELPQLAAIWPELILALGATAITLSVLVVLSWVERRAGTREEERRGG